MRLLLDTHAFLWLLFDPSKLSSEVISNIKSADDVLVSTISLAEISIKYASGKLTLPDDPHSLFLTAIDRSHLSVLELSAEAALTMHKLPLHHRDPFDRLLIAQCLADQLVFASRDRDVKKYPLNVIW